MLPGFVDAHSHFAVAMRMAEGLDLWDTALPPITDIATLQGVIRDYIASHAIAKGGWVIVRSEEHTSELQSLMRISYAVFCLKKKKKTLTPITHTNNNHLIT